MFAMSGRRALAALLFSSALAAGCGKDSGPPPKPRLPPLFVTSAVVVRDVPVEVRAPIDLRPLAQADVGSKTLGYLDAVLVDRGDAVKHGQLVAFVRPSDLPDQLAAARGTLAQTQAQVAQAKANLDRVQQLAPSGIASQQDLQNAQTAVTTAMASQQAAEAQVGVIGVRLGETRIESPLDGVVVVRKLDPGALVGPQAGTGAILTVARVDVLRAFITVGERALPEVRVGQDARIEVDALPGKSVAGKVVRIAPAVDPGTRTVDVEVQIPNAGGALRPGMFGRGAIIVGVHPKALVVPAPAVLTSDAKRFVFVLAGEKVARKPVEIGVDGGDWLEVTKGLEPGAEIVTAGLDALSDGSPVRTAKDVDPYTGKPAASAASSVR